MSNHSTITIATPRNIALGMTYMIDSSASWVGGVAASTEDTRWSRIAVDLDRLATRMREIGAGETTTRAERDRIYREAGMRDPARLDTGPELDALLADPPRFAGTLSRLMGHFVTLFEQAAEQTATPAPREIIEDLDRLAVRLRELAANRIPS